MAERLDKQGPRWPAAVVWAGNVYRRWLAVVLALLGPRAAYGLTGWVARRLYRLLPEVRRRSEAQCAAALSGRIGPGQVPAIAESAFVHRVWDLTDLMLADRYLHAGTFARYGGLLEEGVRAELLDAQRRGQAVILLTGYYGPFDLLPMFLGFNGVRAGVVYRRHANAGFDAYRERIRRRGGCELIPVERAATRCEQILDAGGTVAIVADHHAERRGEPASFLGLPTRVPRSVGLLACRYRADVVVAGIRRSPRPFHFEMIVCDVLKYRDFASEPDPVAYVTRRYLAGLERLILAEPSQYLWTHARWGEAFARQVESHPGTAPPSAAQ